MDIKDTTPLLSGSSVHSCPCSDSDFCLAVSGQSLVLGVHVRRVAVAQRLGEELWQRLDAELPLVGVGLAPAVLLVKWLVMLLLLLWHGVVLRTLEDHVGGHGVLGVALTGVPYLEG